MKFILLSDYSWIANKLKENIKEIHYWDNKKTHMGELFNIESTAIIDTLTDFFILSKSSKIFTNLINDGSISGFSRIVSIIYKIEYVLF